MKLINLAKINFAGGNSGGGQGSSVIPIEVFDPEEQALTAGVGKYYRADTAVDTLAVTLPAIEDDTRAYELYLGFTTGTTPDISFLTTDEDIVRFADGFEFEAGKTYEVKAMFNGSYWSVFNKVIAPFTIGALKFTVNAGSEPGTITLTIPSGLTQEECTNIEYSLDGKTWVTFVNEGNGLTITTPTLIAGDSVYFRGQATLISKSSSKYSRFTTSSPTFKISASGSVMSLIGNSNTLTDFAFYNLFQGCTSLTTAPELPATTLKISCYNTMFRACTQLNKITMLATDISANSCLLSWVTAVATTGTFIKHPAMTTLPTGDNGIPSGWTVQDYVG